MQRYQALAGTLGALPAFESAARLLSFTKAADELGLTQPAISRRISSLEDLLGVAVFWRHHNKLELTVEGRQIFEAVELGLGHLNKIIVQIADGNAERKLTIACGFSFASMWLQPRFSRFRHILDGLEVHLIASEFPDDLSPDTTDIRILWQNKAWPNRDLRPLFAEDVFPICSPAFAERHGLSADRQTPPERLSEFPLLHYDDGGPGDINWIDWFTRHGHTYTPAKPIYVFDNYLFMVQATLDGEGIALGYSALIDAHLSRGNLIQIGPSVHLEDGTLFIEFEPSRLSNERREKIHGWFRQEARRSN